MISFYYKAFSYLDSSKPVHLGIYFSLFLHLSILLFAVGLPDFFKPKQIAIPQIIPIEILNVSDVTSITPKNKNIEIDNGQTKKVKQKKFNSSENTEIQKIDLQEKPKKKITKNEINLDNKDIIKNLDSTKVLVKENQSNDLKNETVVKVNNVETLKSNKIKPKLKPKPIREERREKQSDLEVENKIKPIIKKNDDKKVIDKPKPIQKPEQDFKIASMLKDLRNEEVSAFSEIDDSNKDNLENNEEDEQIKPNLEVSISEIDLVIQQLQKCFNPRTGAIIAGDEIVKIRAEIDRNANVIKGTVQIIDTNISISNPYYETITEAAVATLYNPMCSKLKLPLDKYESWKDFTITINTRWIKN